MLTEIVEIVHVFLELFKKPLCLQDLEKGFLYFLLAEKSLKTVNCFAVSSKSFQQSLFVTSRAQYQQYIFKSSQPLTTANALNDSNNLKFPSNPKQIHCLFSLTENRTKNQQTRFLLIQSQSYWLSHHKHPISFRLLTIC
jgi:hypothetical protein